MLLVLKMDEVARGKEMDYQLEHLEGNIAVLLTPWC